MNRTMLLIGGLILCGCSTIRYSGPYTKIIPVVVPRPQQIEQLARIEGDAIQVIKDSVAVRIEYASPEELNEMYPELSQKRAFSGNPYTYGNWIREDPRTGERRIPLRYLVFRITVVNGTSHRIFIKPSGSFLMDSGKRRYSAIGYEQFKVLLYPRSSAPGAMNIYRSMVRVLSETLLLPGSVPPGEARSGFMPFKPLVRKSKGIHVLFSNIDLFPDADEAEPLTFRFHFDYRIAEQIVRSRRER